MKMSGRDEAESLIAQWASKHLQSAAEPSKQEISENSKTSKGCSIGSESNVAKTPVETSVDYPPLTLYTYPENPRAYKGKTVFVTCKVTPIIHKSSAVAG